ncbi:hypothetical protein N7468_000050 [Penicillium chermesinum]|uniref:Uncharacterized protein n=1 Tax=Penicillium chermesinum TaxID=63820 RepID=A0A9W9TYG7_9EURO|nr:uncharacterized protein N7468_000050 [Penicillium chermesinum]KAJ5248599.1 hypothetical protein N7468_000050 [Penicillium chermesinum]KAJ6150714.1 hypothetical protein N7470_007308 [Penicillium chermesinum]
MAQLAPTRPRPSLARQFANFTNSTAGLDLTLRLCHSLVLIGTGLDLDSSIVTKCAVAASQIGQGRRYLRLFGFLDCFQNVQDILSTKDAFRDRAAMIDLLEFSCLGMYLGLEGTTMLHDMNVVSVSWYTPVLLESYKFWFYAICVAIARTVSVLLFGPAVPTSQKQAQEVQDEKKERRPAESIPARAVPTTSSLLKQLLIDCLDLTIPGSLLGWMPISDFAVSIAMFASTVLAWPSLWAKVQP